MSISLILGISIGGAVVIAAAIGLLIFLRKRNKSSGSSKPEKSKK